jgi:hypothetical protein
MRNLSTYDRVSLILAFVGIVAGSLAILAALFL